MRLAVPAGVDADPVDPADADPVDPADVDPEAPADVDPEARVDVDPADVAVVPAARTRTRTCMRT